MDEDKKTHWSDCGGGKSQFQSYLWIGTKFIHDSVNVRRTSTSRNHEDERAVTSMIITGIFSPPDVCVCHPPALFTPTSSSK